MHKFTNTLRVVPGFTLVELMIVVAVFATLAAISLPKMKQMTSDNQMVSKLNKLSGDLAFARSLAISNNTSVAVYSNNSNANWNDGWNVQIVDTATQVRTVAALNLNGQLSVTATGGGQVDIDGDGNNDAVSGVVFRGNGRTGNGFSAIVCDDRTVRRVQSAKAINVNNVGHLSVANDSNADDIVEDYSGANITCP